jgi:hemoglobin
MKTLFDKYGGFATVSSIVHQFYREVQASPVLKDYFRHVNMERLIEHQTLFVSTLLGGAVQYTGRDMRTAHAGHSIGAAAFAEVADILHSVLEDAGVEPQDIATIMGVVAGFEQDIVTA